MFNRKQKEKELIERANQSINMELDIYRRQGKLKVDEEVLEYRKKVVDNAKLCADQVREQECKWHADKQEKDTELAKLDCAIDHKKALLKELADPRETEIVVLKDLHKIAIGDKDKIIELLKDQVKILTAKLTEIHISDLHLNANVEVKDKK